MIALFADWHPGLVAGLAFGVLGWVLVVWSLCSVSRRSHKRD